ncbi:hypothetical protein Pen02_78430 [Plantactinospora endophytica]|uniref:Uncharacterized protein n=1 Tax=Plantactinospora endophytica TaxID=673535 RepID=A0ABQ4EDV4_9ACTN|nr:hypothetical protein Pen02_78430 [Plantactinospora endophytica]
MLIRSFASDPEPDPPPTTAQQIERLKEELAAAQQTLLERQSRLEEAQQRLVLISKIARDNERCRRAPTVSWAAVRAVLYCGRESLAKIGTDLPVL